MARQTRRPEDQRTIDGIEASTGDASLPDPRTCIALRTNPSSSSGRQGGHPSAERAQPTFWFHSGHSTFPARERTSGLRKGKGCPPLTVRAASFPLAPPGNICASRPNAWPTGNRSGLAQAQRKIAATYGSASWADLMRRVARARGDDAAVSLSPLAAAAHAGDLPTVQRLLRKGQGTEGVRGDGNTPLWLACASDAPADARIAIAEALLAAGAEIRNDGAGGRRCMPPRRAARLPSSSC